MASAVGQLDALVVADQLEVNGVVTDRVREALIAMAQEHRPTVFVVDSPPAHCGLPRRMVLEPNWVEATRALDPQGKPRSDTPCLDEVGVVARALSEQARRPVCVTLGGAGAFVWDGGPVFVPAAPVRPPLDPVGAGDAFVAALATGLGCGATPREAAAFANLAAAVTVEKLGETGTATPDEIRARYALAEAMR